MQISNPTDNNISKSRIQTKVNNDISDSKGWFSNFKKSFGNRKTRIISREVKPREPSNKIPTKSTQQKEKYNDYDSITTTKEVHLSNLSNDFLDSFAQKSCKSFSNEDSKSKFQRYHIKNFMNPKVQMHSLLNLMFSNISEHPRIIEKVLMVVVEDYINSTCEKMLQDKMRSVYKKIENWSKNPLTRPGFKKPESILGGNITKPEKSFVAGSNSRTKKIENCFPNSFYNNYVSTNHDKYQWSKNFLISSTLNNRSFAKTKEAKYPRKNFPLNTESRSHYSIIEKSETGDSLKNKSISHKEKSHKKFKTDFNSDSSRTLTENKEKLLAVRPVMVTSEIKSDVHEDINQKDEHIMENSKNYLMHNKQLNIKTQRHSVCKCLKNHKTSVHCQLSGQKSNNQMSNNIKCLQMCKIVNIDIKPFEKSNPYLFSRIPKHHTTLRMEKQNGAYFTDKDISCNLNSINNKDLCLNRIIRPKIRRSVTFVEPWKGVLNSPLSKDAGFCSEWEVRSEVTKSGILTSTKSEELNYLLSSNVSIPELFESQKDNFSSLINQSSKTEAPSSLLNSGIGNDVTIINDTSLIQERNDCPNNLNDDHTIKSISPVIISLPTTPSFIGDINYPYNAQYSMKTSTSPINHCRNNSFNMVESLGDKKSQTKSSENIINNLHFESNWNIINDNTYIPDFNIHSKPKNYSVIEIIKQSDQDQNVNHAVSTVNVNGKINIPTFTTQLESANSSCESTMIDEDVLITTTSTKSNVSNQQANLQEIILSDEEETFQKSKIQLKPKDSFLLTKMKTANFSSSVRTQEKQSHIESSFKSTIPFLCQFNNQKIHDPKPSNLLKTKQGYSNDSKSSTILDLHICKKDNSSNILKHTVASKQKMRDKATIKTIQEKNPMKFSKIISRIY